MNSISAPARKVPAQILFILLALIFSSNHSAQASWVWSPESGKFVNPEGAVEDTADQQYKYALGFCEVQNYDKAVQELKNLTKKYPGSHVAPEAQFKLGQIYEEQNEYYKAFQTYQKIVENYPNSARINEVIEKEFRIGNVFLSGKKPKFMGVPILPALPRAIEVFEQLVKNAPFSEYGDKAMFQLGIAYRSSGNLVKAVEIFQHFIENYPESHLISDAKFQMGEVSFEMSKNMNRSQEGLESAEDYFQGFLAANPSSDVKEKATQLKKAIDEKNAEKNFKIGQYYESESYLDSAIIYYEDVVRNYAGTSWAVKAKEKLSIFRSPVKFIKEKQDVLEAELTRVALRKKELEEAIQALPKDNHAQREQLTQDLQKVRKQEKEIKANSRSFGRKKVSDIHRRAEALKRKESELIEKKTALEKKKKMMKDNTSEDLSRAFKNWSDSLRAEETALLHEKNELAKVEHELGISTQTFHLPFARKENVQSLQQMHLDALADLMKEKKQWDVKKEELYEFRGSVLTQLNGLRGEDVELLSKKKDFQDLLQKQGGDLFQKTISLDKQKSRLDVLKSNLKEKQERFEKLTGTGSLKKLWKGSTKAVKRSWDFLTFSSQDPKVQLKEAQEKKLELKKAVAEKKGIVEAIQRSFQDELQGKGVGTVSSPLINYASQKGLEKLPEEIQLKKRMKLVEREIRWRYDEIQDRNLSKHKKMDELDLLIKSADKNSRSSALSKASLPARDFYKFFHAFLFGLKQREELIRKESLEAKSGSSASSYDRIQKLREEVEFESILIEARAQEIKILKKDLKALKVKAAAHKGFSYRSVFFERPGTFIEDIVSSAKKVFPKKERREILIEKLGEETKELARLREQKKALGQKVKEIEQGIHPKQQAPVSHQQMAHGSKETAAALSEVAKLEDEIVALQKEVEVNETSYQKDRNAVQGELKEFYRRNFSKRIEERFGLDEQAFQDKKKIYDKERKKTEAEILKIVKKEEKIVRKEQELLTEKKEKISEKITDFKKKEDYRSEVLENELEGLLSQVRQVQTEQQNLTEEKKKISESLDAEVGSFER